MPSLFPFSLRRTLLAALALPALLTACTGTTEDEQVKIRVAILTGAGDAAFLTPVDVGGVIGDQVPVKGAVDIQTVQGGNQIAVLFGNHLEFRDANLANPTAPLPNPAAPGFKPCYVKLEASTALDRFAALSDCGGGALQQVAVWRSDGTLAFSATLTAPTPTEPLDTHIAVQGDTFWAVHPAIGGGSELLVVTRNSDGSSTLAPSVLTPNIYGLVFYRGAVYVATDTGVQTLAASGTLTALPGETQLATVNTDLYASTNLLAVWYDDNGNSNALRIWNATKTGSPNLFTDLRDLTFAPDGTFYVLNAASMIQYDSSFGLADTGWREANLANVVDPRAVTWLIPPAN
ncbi:hypothetical protein [Deinococcus sp.]|uniref:hypothetical protein n=1 Tax=Deinococcus sp. TaxID=47478 RepID=UPI003B5A2276